MNNRFGKILGIISLIVTIDASLLFSSESPETQRLIQLGILEETGSYSYNTEGRSDPFKPFITPQSLTPNTPDPNEIIENSQELSGMQLFEPGQLTLVGIIATQSNAMALVEDQSRKGYVLKIGTLIGKRGVVTQILSDKVQIEETAKTRSGQELKSIVSLTLKKEGDR